MLKRVRPLPGQTGIVVGIGGQPLALEAFDHPQTLHEQFEAIVRAACLDALGRPALPTPGRRARRLVERLEKTKLDHEPDVGQTSKLGRARTTDLDVMSLQQSLPTAAPARDVPPPPDLDREPDMVRRKSRLSTAQTDRAAGVLLASAAGDALGVPYEFAHPPGAGELAEMKGGGLGDFAPGEWSDDTSMAMAIAEVAATGADLTTDDALDAIAAGFLRWYGGGPADIGIQTSAVLGATRRRLDREGGRPAAVMSQEAAAYAATQAHVGRQRRTDAHRAGRAGPPRRQGEARTGRPARGPADPRRPARRRLVRAVVRGHPGRRPQGPHRRPGRPRPAARRPPRPVGVLARRGRDRPGGPLHAQRVHRHRTPGRARGDHRPHRTTTATTSRTRCTRPSGSATTPTPSPPSPAGCSEPGGVRARCRGAGDGPCTAGPAGTGETWSRSPP